MVTIILDDNYENDINNELTTNSNDRNSFVSVISVFHNGEEQGDSDKSEKNKNSSFSIGVLIGIISSVICICLCCGIVVWLYCKSKAKKVVYETKKVEVQLSSTSPRYIMSKIDTVSPSSKTATGSGRMFKWTGDYVE